MSSAAIHCDGFNHVGRCRHGLMLYNTHDKYVGRSLALYGEFSEGEVSLFRQLVRPGDIVLDVGANIGTHTVAFARLVGGSGAVHAFEPQRLLFQALCANVALNSLTNVHCHHAAAAEDVGEIFVPQLNQEAENNFGGLGLGRHNSGEPVRTMPLDDLPLSACRLLKVDVEGMERTVLMGSDVLIRTFRPILYVENDRQEQSDALIEYIDNLGYSMYWHLPPLYNDQNFLGNETNVFGKIRSVNLLCIPSGAAILVQGFRQVRVGDRHVFARNRGEAAPT